MADQPLSAQGSSAWFLWGRKLGETNPRPLGCYASREVALEAERMANDHPNAPLWEDFWVSPWPLETEPRVNFRMSIR